MLELASKIKTLCNAIGGFKPPHATLLLVTSLAKGGVPAATVTVTTLLETMQVFELKVDKTFLRNTVVEDKLEGV